MPPDAALARRRQSQPWVPVAVVVWAILLSVLATRQALQRERTSPSTPSTATASTSASSTTSAPGALQVKNSVFGVFARAGRNWLDSANVYENQEYRYSPAVAGALVPLALLPMGLASTLWLLINAAVFLWGFCWWARVALPPAATEGPTETMRADHVAALLLVTTPLTIGNFNNLQTNPLVIGLLLAAVAGTLRARWNLVALCIVAATLLKIVPLALGLVLIVLYPKQLSWRVMLAIVLGLALPFLMQRPSYVLQSYRDWGHCLTIDTRGRHSYRDLFALWTAVTGQDLDALAGTPLRLAGVAAVGLTTLLLPRSLTAAMDRRKLMLLLGLVVAWIMLLGPSTESTTYILLAPLVTWTALASWCHHWPMPQRLLFGAAYWLEIAASVSIIFRGGGNVQLLLQPLGALLFLMGLVHWWHCKPSHPHSSS